MTDVRPPAAEWPQWSDEIARSLPICPQFVVYGNIHDVYLTPVDGGLTDLSLIDSLWERLTTRGYQYLLIFNSSNGLRLVPRSAASSVAAALQRPIAEIPLQGLEQALSAAGDVWVQAANLPAIVEAVHASSLRGALVIENASRLVREAGRLDEQEQTLFAALERILREARPHAVDQGPMLFNPTFWLCDGVRDLPDWLVVAQDRSRAIALPMPDEQARGEYARMLASQIESGTRSEEPETSAFGGLSHGLNLKEMRAVAMIARDQQVGLADIADAIRSYKVGQPRDPWQGADLKKRLRDGEARIGKGLKGQAHAVRRTLDILKRSATGLSGAQAGSSPGRPRGVLFFAGPTGVGKTELAKAISALVFEAEDAVVRFDMSEFAAEHSDARLIGAPPGFVGYDRGGELVNAIRRQPFSVLLFDEIEKANARILDKFLQILEDGRLTDGRGDTVYFSEAIIIFTSNLGVSTRGRDGSVQYHVKPGDPYETVSKTIKGGIRRHFWETLQRPELLNRIGEDNIIVFDFIDEPTSEEIVDKNLGNVRARLLKARGFDLDISEEAKSVLREEALKDPYNGGRGIGGTIERCLVNPLSRQIFDRDDLIPGKLTVRQIVKHDTEWEVELEQ